MKMYYQCHPQRYVKVFKLMTYPEVKNKLKPHRYCVKVTRIDEEIWPLSC